MAATHEKSPSVELSVDGKRQVVDIGDLILEACELIIPKIGNAIKRNVAGADPEYQQILRNNIILCLLYTSPSPRDG